MKCTDSVMNSKLFCLLLFVIATQLFEPSSWIVEFVERLENLPAESNNVRTNATVCEINGKSAKNIARKSVNHQLSENPPNGYKEGSVVFFCSKRDHIIQCLQFPYRAWRKKTERLWCCSCSTLRRPPLTSAGSCGSEVSHRKLASWIRACVNYPAEY